MDRLCRNLPSWTVCLATILLFSGAVSADEVSLERIEQYRVMLAEQEERDASKSVQEDLALAKGWLKEAEVLLAQGDETLAKSRMKRVEFAIDLIRQLVLVGQMRKAADDQEAAAYKAPQTLKELEQDVADLESQQRKLETDLKNVRGAGR